MSGRRVHVAVGVIRSPESGKDQILLSKRLDHLHQGGLWEFPGGKVEPGETVQQALQRELHEELGISLCDAEGRADSLRPLIQISHDYQDKQVLLDVWEVPGFEGEAEGREGQEVRWVDTRTLPDYEFPEANKPIISACLLPSMLAITPDIDDQQQLFEYLDTLQQAGARAVVLRQTQLSYTAYCELARAVLERYQASAMQILLHGDPEKLWPEFESGVHMPAVVGLAKKEPLAEPLRAGRHLGMSCHSPEELAQAHALGVSYATLSPVCQTESHPDTTPLGWQCFADWVQAAKVPVYALGGMRSEDLMQARQAGAQGIAGIRGLFSDLGSETLARPEPFIHGKTL